MDTKVKTGAHEKHKPVWAADLGDGYYKNPIIYADYADPDVIRVGEDFFLVASSFNMSPCLPILHSKDLVNWKLINHVADRLPFPKYDLPRHGEGVWAPSIRYHEGEFWVFFATPDEGIFMSRTYDPFGTWSQLHLVKQCRGWIDPCPFWDDDGQAYLVHAFAKSRIGFKSILQICKMKEDGTALLDEGTYIFDGNRHHPTIEGPKMYKRNGYYYIFAPAGGVATGWQTILRSKSVYGPYEDKIVLHQGNTEINGPHQGGWVDLESGKSWFVHFQDQGAYGRITHLQPMYWENDWPVMGQNVNDQGIGEPVIRWRKPDVSIGSAEITVPQTSDEFVGDALGLQWQWRANTDTRWYTLQESYLRLYALQQPEGVRTFYDTPQIVTQKFPAPAFSATALLTFRPQTEKEYAGLIIFGQEYSGLMVKKSATGVDILQFTGVHESDNTYETEQSVAHVQEFTLYLRVEVNKQAECRFSYSVDDQNYQPVGRSFTAKQGRWIGAQIGIFCLNKGKEISSGYADFEWFRIHE